MIGKISYLLITNILIATLIVQPVYGLATKNTEYSFNDPDNITLPDSNGKEIVEDIREISGTKKFLKDTAVIYSFVWGARFFYVRNKDDRIFDTSFSKWMDNITDIAVDDGDTFFTNYVVHSYFGYFYYLYYREMGHDVWTSALGSTVMSTLWEYTIEGPVEPPSLTDLVATPGIGIPLGIAMENISGWLEKRDNPIARASSYVLNPIKLFAKDNKRGLFNPITGNYAYQTSFTLNENKKRAIELAYPFFLESPQPLGQVSGNLEYVNLKEKFGGHLILYSVRIDYPSDDKNWGIYIRVPFAGVRDVLLDGEEIDDGWELANAQLGIKKVHAENSHFALSSGLELTVPSIYKDNLDRLKAASVFTRDLPELTRDMITVSPYLSSAYSGDFYSVQGNLGADLMFRSEEFEDDFFEMRFNYGVAKSIDIPVTGSPQMFVEFNGHTIATADTIKKTDLFITPGARLGSRFSPGVRLQIPLSGPTAEVARSSVMVDMQVRF